MEENKIDIIKYIDRFYKSVMRLKALFLMIIIACFLVLEVKEILFFQTTYSSTAVFVPSLESRENIYMSGDDTDDFLNAFCQLLTGDMMKDVIKSSLDIDTINANINVVRIADTNLLQLTVTSSSANDAYDIAVCIMSNYNQVIDFVMSDVVLSVVDEPLLASSPDAYPHYIKVGLKAIGIGMMICFVFALLNTLLRRTINNSDDVKEMIHLQTLAKIPYISRNKKNYSKISHLLLSNPSIHYHFKQSFLDLRMNIEQSHKKNQKQVFMLTSTLPNEGKSMVSTNLAIALAQKKNKVILIDADLRNPSIFNTLKEQEITGNIVDYLEGRYQLEEVLNQYKDLSLDIIYGVDGYQKATELLSKGNLEKLIIELRKKYDYVILDVPPLYMMDDALIIGELCDSAIVVVKQDYASGYDILEAVEELNEHVHDVLGVVINQAKRSFFDEETNRYGYGYGYGYGRE